MQNDPAPIRGQDLFKVLYGSTFKFDRSAIPAEVDALVAQRKSLPDKVILTGGLSYSTYFTQVLSEKAGKCVEPTSFGRYAGALGASLLAEEKKS